MAGTMSCPHCGYQWESYARSQTSRRGRCRAAVYVPAAVRNAGVPPPARPVRATDAPRRSATPGPVRSETFGGDDGGRGPSVRRARPYATAARTTTPAPTPASVRVVIGAVGRWACGHEANVPQAATTASWRPETTPCPRCQTPGLLAQRTGDGWAPVAVEDAPVVQPPVPPAGVVPTFTGVPSPSASAGLDYWRLA